MTARHQIRRPSEKHGNQKYGEEDVVRWRKMIREQRLRKVDIMRLEGIKSRTTIDNYMEIY